MKRFFACFAVITAMVFIVGCGDGEKGFAPHNEDSSNNDNSDSSSGENGTCTNGDFKCRNERVSLSCMNGKWLAKECDYDETCNSSTGKCGRNSSSGESGESSSKTCTEQGAFRCNGDMSQKCDQEEWKNFEDCAYTCNATTGKCKGSEEPQPATNCGNGIIESGEVCDSNAMDCESIDSSYTGGFATCKSDCTGWNTTGCAKKSGCAKIADCFFSHTGDESKACLQGEGLDDFNTLYNCWMGCGDINCAQCAAEYEACYGEPLTMNCGAIYNCIADCGQDAECQQGCKEKGSQEGQAQVNALIQCISSNCASATDLESWVSCVNDNCSNELSDCGIHFSIDI